MSGRESGREAHSAETTNPDALEVVAGFQHQKLEGWVPDLATPEETLAALEQAFDYRGGLWSFFKTPWTSCSNRETGFLASCARP